MKTVLTLSFLMFTALAFAQNAEDEKIYRVVQHMPVYNIDECAGLPRGELKECSDEGLAAEIQSKLRYPRDAKLNGVEGMVVITFVIDEEGLIEDAKVKRKIGYGCDEEALRIIENLDNDWTPGYQDGIPVKVQFNYPVRFKIPN